MELTLEQSEYVKGHMGREPAELTGAQKSYIINHWNKEVDLEEYFALFPPPEFTPKEAAKRQEILELLKKAVAFDEKRKTLFQRLMDVPEPDWLVEGFAVREGITLLYGDKGQGKTSLMLQLIGSLQERQQMLGLKVGQARTLLIEQDENPTLLRGHVDRMMPVHPTLQTLEVPVDTVQWNNDKMDFDNPDLVNDLITYSRADLVIIDSLSSLAIDDINHPKSAAVFDRLRLLAREHNCAFIVLHHPNRNGEVMGSNLIQAKVDVILRLHEGTLGFYKLRGTYPATVDVIRKPPQLKVEQDKATLVFKLSKTALGKARTTAIRNLLSQGKPRAEVIELIRKDFGGTKDAVARAVDREKKRPWQMSGPA